MRSKEMQDHIGDGPVPPFHRKLLPPCSRYIFSILKVEAAGYSETSVTSYRFTRCHFPEHTGRCGLQTRCAPAVALLVHTHRTADRAVAAVPRLNRCVYVEFSTVP